MKYIKQLVIIMLFVFLGELANHFIPLTIPASIYGMIFLFIALCTKVVKLEQIEETGEFLLAIMLVFFVPAAVGIMDTFLAHQNNIIKIVIIVFISTIVVLTVTAVVSQIVIKISNKFREQKDVKDVKNNKKEKDKINFKKNNNKTKVNQKSNSKKNKSICKVENKKKSKGRK